ncbi:BlaI/MecI/CopY family transcriptional regulator, partial [candidate division KSB1 bacterium]|nr:BlaI/MecI/CopY family transcriptional regulator [candidate division KSB1 bacterium]
LTPLEWEVMNVVWELGRRPSVREVIDRAYPNKEKAYTTIHTVMNNMEAKNFLKKKKIGLVNFYKPTVKREKMIEGATKTFVKRVFKGSFLELANYLVNSDSLSDKEFADLYKVIKNKSKK